MFTNLRCFRLLTVAPEVWNISTIQKFTPLLDNYVRDTLVNEYVTAMVNNYFLRTYHHTCLSLGLVETMTSTCYTTCYCYAVDKHLSCPSLASVSPYQAVRLSIPNLAFLCPQSDRIFIHIRSILHRQSFNIHLL